MITLSGFEQVTKIWYRRVHGLVAVSFETCTLGGGQLIDVADDTAPFGNVEKWLEGKASDSLRR